MLTSKKTELLTDYFSILLLSPMNTLPLALPPISIFLVPVSSFSIFAALRGYLHYNGAKDSSTN